SSATEAPVPRQSSISSAAWRRTGSASVAGPALKLNARMGEAYSSNSALSTAAISSAASSSQGRRSGAGDAPLPSQSPGARFSPISNGGGASQGASSTKRS